jgi:predicted nucleotidyltransferase
MDNNLIIDQLVSILANTPIVELAYLFGSQVRGTTGPISDIDLGVLFADKVNTLSASSKLAYELQKALQSQQIDIVALRDVPIELAYAIIAEGICIYQRDNTTRVEFEAHVLSRYGDYLPVLLSQRQEILGDESDDRRVQRYREALRRTERTLSKIRAIQE